MNFIHYFFIILGEVFFICMTLNNKGLYNMSIDYKQFFSKNIGLYLNSSISNE